MSSPYLFTFSDLFALKDRMENLRDQSNTSANSFTKGSPSYQLLVGEVLAYERSIRFVNDLISANIPL